MLILKNKTSFSCIIRRVAGHHVLGLPSRLQPLLLLHLPQPAAQRLSSCMPQPRRTPTSGEEISKGTLSISFLFAKSRLNTINVYINQSKIYIGYLNYKKKRQNQVSFTKKAISVSAC